MLKYHFIALFEDGSFLTQNEDDVSRIDPTRSAFYDVFQRKDEVVVFALRNMDTELKVDLGTGLFELNGMPFRASNPSEQLPPETKYRLVFFRRHQHIRNLGNSEESHNIEYHIGWQATVNGKNYQQTIAIG